MAIFLRVIYQFIGNWELVIVAAHSAAVASRAFSASTIADTTARLTAPAFSTRAAFARFLLDVQGGRYDI